MLRCSMAVALGSHAVGELRQRASSALGTTPGVVSQTFSLPDQLAGPCSRPFFWTGAYAADAPPARPGRMTVHALTVVLGMTFVGTGESWVSYLDQAKPSSSRLSSAGGNTPASRACPAGEWQERPHRH